MPAPTSIVVRDRREKTQFSIHNLIMDHWLPVITERGLTLYALYVKMANKADERSFPGYGLITSHTGFSSATVSQYNRLLEWCELILIQHGNIQVSNDYYILDVPEATPERLAAVRAAALAWSNTAPFTRALLRRLDAWQPLQAHFKNKNRHKLTVIHPQQIALALPSEAITLVAKASALPSEATTLVAKASALATKVEQSEVNNPNRTIQIEQSNSNSTNARVRANGHAAPAAVVKNMEQKHVQKVLDRAGFRAPAPAELTARGVDLMTALEWAYWVQSDESDAFTNPRGYAISRLKQNPNASTDAPREISKIMRDDPDRFKCAGICDYCADGEGFDETIDALLALDEIANHHRPAAKRTRPVVTGKLAHAQERG